MTKKKEPASDKDELELKKKKPWLFEPCWKCGKNYRDQWSDAPGRLVPHIDSQAVLALKCSDESFSGMFHIPLCWACACTPHNNLPEKFRIL